MSDTVIMRGKDSAKAIKERVRFAVSKLAQPPYNITVKLVVILVGNNPASELYIRQKEKQAHELGIVTEVVRLPVDTNPEILYEQINQLNADPSVTSIILQLPLPLGTKDITLKAMKMIDPLKDADCFNPTNIGLSFLGRANIQPCTAHGVIQMLDHYQVDVKGQHVVVVGTSNLAGKPLAVELINRQATVTTCNIHTPSDRLRKLMRSADILVVAIGRANYFDAASISEGCIVIDVGINKVRNASYNQEIAEQIDLMGMDYVVNKYARENDLEVEEACKKVRMYSIREFTCGDVDFDSMIGHAKMITAVPGGVGVLTVANLLHNTVVCALLQNRLDFAEFGLENYFYHNYNNHN